MLVIGDSFGSREVTRSATTVRSAEAQRCGSVGTSLRSRRTHYGSLAMDARILVVEDDADLRDAMAAALVADGHAVDVSADGDAALQALAEGGHDVVLLDIALGNGP